MKNLNELLSKLKLKGVKDYEIFKEALTHRSYSKKNNERLEFLGDAVLELAITELLYHDFPEKTEGELTSFRSAIVKTKSLSEEAQKLRLGDYIYMSRGEEATGGRNREYILADIFESLIGAIYIDMGYDVTKEFIKKHLYYKIFDIVENRLDIDAKSKLQEYTQEKFKQTPYYRVIDEEGPDHDKTFTVMAVIGEKEYETGTGKSKQMAEQDAARKTLNKYFPEIFENKTKRYGENYKEAEKN